MRSVVEGHDLDQPPGWPFDGFDVYLHQLGATDIIRVVSASLEGSPETRLVLMLRELARRSPRFAAQLSAYVSGGLLLAMMCQDDSDDSSAYPQFDALRVLR